MTNAKDCARSIRSSKLRQTWTFSVNHEAQIEATCNGRSVGTLWSAGYLSSETERTFGPYARVLLARSQAEFENEVRLWWRYFIERSRRPTDHILEDALEQGAGA